MVHRLVNIFFLFALIFVFIIVANAGEHLRISIALLLALLFSLTAFLLNWLTLDGAVSAGIFGVISLGLGDWQSAVLVLAFFITASLLSTDTKPVEEKLSVKFRRDGSQVWANGFWFALWVMIWFVSHSYIFLIAAAASIAAANADTWATEVGNRFKGRTWLIINFEEVQKGTDGGISVLGSIAALLGSGLIAALFWVTHQPVETFYLILILSSGFVASFIDSYLGAKYQGKKMFFNPLSSSEKQVTMDNNVVNWLSTGFSSTIVLILTLII